MAAVGAMGVAAGMVVLTDATDVVAMGGEAADGAGVAVADIVAAVVCCCFFEADMQGRVGKLCVTCHVTHTPPVESCSSRGRTFVARVGV